MLYFQFWFHYHSSIPKAKLFSTMSFQKKKKKKKKKKKLIFYWSKKRNPLVDLSVKKNLLFEKINKAW